MLISGKVDEQVVLSYPEFNRLTFPIHLEMFKSESLHEAKNVYREMEHAVSILVHQMLTILKLLLLGPFTSC